jgi:hypothetical protein
LQAALAAELTMLEMVAAAAEQVDIATLYLVKHQVVVQAQNLRLTLRH